MATEAATQRQVAGGMQRQVRTEGGAGARVEEPTEDDNGGGGRGAGGRRQGRREQQQQEWRNHPNVAMEAAATAGQVAGGMQQQADAVGAAKGQVAGSMQQQVETEEGAATGVLEQAEGGKHVCSQCECLTLSLTE